MFSDKERAYLESQHLARIGTVADDMQPDVAPVGFEFDGEYFYIGGMRNSATRKYKNVAGGNTKVALTIDDLESVDPWKPRGIRIFGTADIVERESYVGSGAYLRLKPTVTWSWQIEESSFQDGKFVPKKTIW
jgi:pyridoxamine 5'-phosphate oxidase family protein